MESLQFKKPDKKKKIIFYLVIVIIALAILIYSLIKAGRAVTSFFEVNTLKFHNPIEIEVYKPVEIVSREQVAKDKALEEKSAWVADECLKMMINSLTGTPTPKPKQTSGLIKVVEAAGPQLADIDNIVSFIKWRESNNCKANNTGALNVYCENLGKSNCYGYNPSRKQCFENESIAKAVVTQRVSDLLEEFGNIPQALCRYNGGTPLSDCQYYQDYLKYSLK